MATEQAAPNPAQKAEHDVFPVRQVLGLLQRNERLSEQPMQLSPAPPRPQTEGHQENQESNVTPSEDIVAVSPPSRQDEVGLEPVLTKGEDADSLSCPKCAKTFPSGTSLRTHLANLYPCDQPRPVILPREGKMESKACFKCGKTFASWQGLRGHLNRVKPCDQDKPTAPSTRRRPAASRTCAKCGKTFSSPQSLRIHMNRVKPCDQDVKSVSAPTTPPATTSPAPSLTMNSDDMKKEAERKARARYQARKAYLKKRGRLGELGDPPSVYYQSGKDPKSNEEIAPKPDLKRSEPEEPSHENENADMTNVEPKRPRVQEDALQPQKEVSTDWPSDVSGLAEPVIPAPTQSVPIKKVQITEGGFLHRSNKGHGGDLLAGGCSCPPCVRRWARKLMNRMQQLEDDVLVLRQNNSGGAAGVAGSPLKPLATSKASSDKTTSIEVGRPTASAATSAGALSSNNAMVAVVSQAKTVEIFKSLTSTGSETATTQLRERRVLGSGVKTILPRSIDKPPQNEARLGGQQQPTASVLQGFGSDKRSLMDAYSHMNDQILINERTVEDSAGHVQILVGYNPATAMDFRRQVEELRVSISAEKSKRDVTVAALIAHEWRPRRDEFKTLLESANTQNSPNKEQAYHAQWSEIAKHVSVKDNILGELEKRMGSLGESGGSNRSRYAEMGELSSKMAAEYAAKMALESERNDIYVGLVKSSTRIRSLVRNALWH